MAAITAALIKQVREETGAGMMDVKKALTEAEGDVARAKEIIRAKGIQAAGKREGRKAQEGTIASTVVESANGQTGYAVELNSETDFVAKTPKFVEFAGSVLDEALGHATQLVRALAEHRALFRRNLAHHVHNLRDLALSAEERHACLFKLFRICRGGNHLLRARLQRIEIVNQTHVLPLSKSPGARSLWNIARDEKKNPPSSSVCSRTDAIPRYHLGWLRDVVPRIPSLA